MLFHTFKSQVERRRFGGSSLIEVQFCKLPIGTEINRIVAVDSIQNWQLDSLYIADDCCFYQEYGRIFNCGTYNNLKSGVVDIYGINYYADSLIDPLIQKIYSEKPMDFDVLIKWLTKAKNYNGFYILGI